MSGNPPPSKPLICPACFAREIDPVFLHFDAEDGGEFYCQHCGYTAKTREQALAFLHDFVAHRHPFRSRADTSSGSEPAGR